VASRRARRSGRPASKNKGMRLSDFQWPARWPVSVGWGDCSRPRIQYKPSASAADEVSSSASTVLIREPNLTVICISAWDCPAWDCRPGRGRPIGQPVIALAVAACVHYTAYTSQLAALQTEPNRQYERLMMSLLTDSCPRMPTKF